MKNILMKFFPLFIFFVYPLIGQCQSSNQKNSTDSLKAKSVIVTQSNPYQAKLISSEIPNPYQAKFIIIPPSSEDSLATKPKKN